jgi:hypothetical protein
MRVAALYDVHGNLPALERFARWLREPPSYEEPLASLEGVL